MASLEVLETYVVRVPKWQFEFVLVRTPKGIYIPIVTFCRRLGIQQYRQIQKLRADPDFAPYMETCDLITPRGKKETWCLKRRSLAGWLYTITPNKVRHAYRAGLSEFRQDSMDAMDRALFGEVEGSIEDPRREVARIEQGISDHAYFLEERVDNLEGEVEAIKEVLAEDDEEEMGVGEGNITCPHCGRPFHVRMIGD